MTIDNCRLQIAVALAVCAGTALGAPQAVRSGPQVGERPLPFTSNVVTGPNRGKQHCYICELKDEPAVLVFARRPDAATARLLRELREAVREHENEKLFGWLVFLGEEGAAPEADLERRAYELARQHGVTSLPITALGDPAGPPGYQIAPEAEVTVLVFRSGKVLYNRAYRAREWNVGAAGAALKELPRWIGRAGGSNAGSRRPQGESETAPPPASS